MPALEIAQRAQAVERFLQRLQESHDEDDRENALLNISGLIQFAQRFYIPFFKEELYPPIEITGFLYRDKRKVARQLVGYEAMTAEEIEETAETNWDAAADAEELMIAVTDLAELYEELVDALQGDLEFGYSGDIANFREFHNELYPTWLEAVAKWIEVQGEEAEDLEALTRNYRDVAAT